MRIVLFETSCDQTYVGLAEHGRLIASWSHDPGRQHARDITPAYDRLLREAGWLPSSLDSIVVDIGPGSYTGLRVGVMTANSIAYLTNASLIGVPTTQAIVHGLDQPADQDATRLDTTDRSGAIVSSELHVADDASNIKSLAGEMNQAHVIIDAQRGLVYHQSFTQSGQEWSASSELSIKPLADWQAEVRHELTKPSDDLHEAKPHSIKTHDAQTIIAGPAVARYREALSVFASDVNQQAGRAVLSLAEQYRPNLYGLLRAGMCRHNNQMFDDWRMLEPLYLRASSAELKKSGG